jgi:hypothetical protein
LSLGNSIIQIMMKRSQKRIQKVLLIAVSSFLLLQPALNEPDVIAEIAIFYPAPAFEHAHWETLFSQNHQGKYQGISNVSLLMSFMITDPFNRNFHLTFSPFISLQQCITLRC